MPSRQTADGTLGVDAATLKAITSTGRTCSLAIGLTVLISFGGQSFATGATEMAAAWITNLNPAFIRFSGPALATVYQVLLFWLVIGWLTGKQRTAALALHWPALKLRHWLAIVVGVYAVKAITSLIIVGGIHALSGNPAAGASGNPIEAVAPFAAIMRQPIWPVLFAAGILAAIAEEMIYRGYLSQTLEGSKLGFWGGATLAAVIWAGLHLYYPVGIQIMLVLVGVTLSWVRRQTGSIYPGMAWHILNNMVALIAMKLIG
jgi:membrane protease YdiL (CAAX protease family)